MAGKKQDKERERAFYENGSKLHEKLIASCNGRPIPIRSYSCEELQRATNNFDRSRIFHTDGLYEWYNGSFEDRMISIKKYRRNERDYLFTDIAVSAKMSTHNNVLKLIGCCLETEIPISVYESAANGSLFDVFKVTSDHDGAQQHQREPLSWQSRLKIAREIAHAISYLHTAFSRPVVHRDIKPGNVFLDRHGVAKLTDFSLSILIPEGETHVEDDVCGTYGFLCPHYMATEYITEKVDVYGFGSFLLVLLTGQSLHELFRTTDFLDVEGKLQDPFNDHLDVEDFENDRKRFTINECVDPAILVGEEGSVVWQQLQAVLRLALICRKKDPEIRPDMVDVTKELRKIERFMHHQHPHQQQQQDSSLESDPQLPVIRIHHPASPRHHSSGVGATPTSTAGARRKIGVAVDLSDESAYAVRWAVHHYIRPGDAVILLHVSPTSVLFGADWGSIDLSISSSDFDRHPDDVTATATTTSSSSSNNQKKLEDDFDAFTASIAADLAWPLKEAQIPYKIHIVKYHDMKERLCLEVERLGISAVIMGSRGFGAVRRGNDDGGLSSVSDYCVQHCVCPVVVVRYPEDKDAIDEAVLAVKEGEEDDEAVIKTVPIEGVHEKG